MIPLPSRILHVDDDPILRDIVRRALKKSSFPLELESCSSAKEAFEKLESFNPDLFLVDCVMSEMGGLDMIRHIRSMTDAPCRNAPAILISGKVEESLSAEEISIGIVGLIRKPFPIAALPQIVLNMWNAAHPADFVSRA
jgi:two-component system sensor histidine kinase/response regulator